MYERRSFDGRLFLINRQYENKFDNQSYYSMGAMYLANLHVSFLCNLIYLTFAPSILHTY